MKSSKFPPDQQAAFLAATAAMRLYNGLLTQNQLFLEANAAIRKTYPDTTVARRRSISRYVAYYVHTRYQHSKSRARAKESRGAKDSRNHLILAEYLRQQDSRNGITYQELASKFNISASSIQRILQQNGISPRATVLRKAFPETAKRMVGFLDVAMPKDGIRLVHTADLAAAVDVDEQGCPDLFRQITGSRQPLQIYFTDEPTRDGRSVWAVVERGRQKSPEGVKEWAARTFELGAKKPSVFDDFRVVIKFDSAELSSNPVLRDYGSVILVKLGSRDPVVWRRFIDASISPKRENAPKDWATANDRQAIMTAINGAARLRRLDDVLDDMHNWISDPHDKEVAQWLFAMVRTMWTSAPWSSIELLEQWMLDTRYQERIYAGDLPGRSVADSQMLACFAEFDADEATLLSEFRTVPTGPIPPFHRTFHKSDMQQSHASEHATSGSDDEDWEDGDEDYDEHYDEDINGDLDGFIYPLAEDDD